jgi:hypothetical protein
MPTKGIKYGSGTLYFNGAKYEGMVADYEFDGEEASVRLESFLKTNLRIGGDCNFTVNISRIQLLKIAGLWDMMLTLCPDRRVKHFMQHGSDRVKIKNFYHACRLIGKMAREVK